MKFNNTLIRSAIALCFILVVSNVMAQTGCDAEITVYKNRIYQGLPPSGGLYNMVLTNNGTSQDTYTLSTLNVNNSCSNTDGSSTADNVALNVSFLNYDKEPIDEITVIAGESARFLVSVTIPSNTNVERWSCNEVVATSQTCSNYAVKTVLKSWVINPINGE